MPLQIAGAGHHLAEWYRATHKTAIHNKCPESSSEELVIGILRAQLTQTTRNYKMQLSLLMIFKNLPERLCFEEEVKPKFSFLSCLGGLNS